MVGLNAGILNLLAITSIVGVWAMKHQAIVIIF